MFKSHFAEPINTYWSTKGDSAALKIRCHKEMSHPSAWWSLHNWLCQPPVVPKLWMCSVEKWSIFQGAFGEHKPDLCLAWSFRMWKWVQLLKFWADFEWFECSPWCNRSGVVPHLQCISLRSFILSVHSLTWSHLHLLWWQTQLNGLDSPGQCSPRPVSPAGDTSSVEIKSVLRNAREWCRCFIREAISACTALPVLRIIRDIALEGFAIQCFWGYQELIFSQITFLFYVQGRAHRSLSIFPC